MASYDQSPYRAFPIPEAHVDRLHLVACLFGMEPAPLSSCRVLELGCADGGHLVPMAEALPGSEFVGVDLSSRQIDDGRRWTEPLGLNNLTLLHADAFDLPDLGAFDHIICHGMFSWIDAPLRPRLFQLLADRLTPTGVGYVSYNTLPGGYTRRRIRDFILRHGASSDDPSEQVDAARAMIAFLHDASDPEQAHGRLVRRHCQALLSSTPQYLLHGLLAPVNDAMYLHDVVAMAEDHGLAYLGDGDIGRMTGAGLHDAGRAALGDVPGDVVDHEQILDELQDRCFRQSLFVRAGVELQRRIPWHRLRGTWLSARVRPMGTDASGRQVYGCDPGTLRTDEPIWQAGLEELGSRWPGQIRFESWCDEVTRRTGRSLADVAPTLGRESLDAHAARMVDISPRSYRIESSLPTRPHASAWARRQAELQLPVTDLRHRYRRLNDAIEQFLPWCDGTRTVPELQQRAGDRDAEELVEALRVRSLLLEEAPP